MTSVPAAAETPTARQAAVRWRWIGVVALVLVLIAAGTLLLSGSTAARDEFAPDNPGPLGARAVAEVLRQQGVDVIVTRDPAEAGRLASGATLLVDDSGSLLDAGQWESLRNATDRLVVVAPSSNALDGLVPDAAPSGVPSTSSVQAACRLPLARRAGRMSLTDTSSSLRLDPRADGALDCFTDPGDRGQLVESDDGTVTLLASRVPFENRHVGELGNAAVALNVLGARHRLVWLRPDPAASAATAQPTLETLTPQWVTPMLVLVLLAGVAAACWRGRRLGPLVVEQLPVVVRSRETVEGRARLYARAGARLRAADALRIGTIGRLAPALGLSRLATVDDVITATAARTGRDRPALRALLLDAVPTNDAALVALSDDLARLEAAVLAATRPGLPAPPTEGAP